MESSKSNVWCGFKSSLGNHGCVVLDIFKNTCNQKIFDITRTNANSQVQCSTIQFKGCKCGSKITKGSFCTFALVFYGWFKLVGNKEANMLFLNVPCMMVSFSYYLDVFGFFNWHYKFRSGLLLFQDALTFWLTIVMCYNW
jgi:hypothetical protein